MKEAPANSSIKTIIQNQRIIVCCGTGGVGKTTTSAALGLAAARLGRKALVITIDPAKRLATSLGLQQLSNEPQDLTAVINEQLQSTGEPSLSGRFSAVVPDSEKTFESFVRSVAGNRQDLSARVLKTSIYKIFTKEFSGAHEYMAMEKLYQVSTGPHAPDLIVLDTPPSTNTRLFLQAPHLLAGFFDETIMKWLTAPGGKLLASGIQKIIEILESLTGRGFISDLVEFTTALFQLRGQFLDNLDKVSTLLHGPAVSFLMVTSSERLTKSDTQSFVETLRSQGFPFWGFVVNRVLRARIRFEKTESEYASLFRETLSEAEIEILLQNFKEIETVFQHEKEAANFLKSLSKQINVCEVPEQPTDVHTLGALHELAQAFL